MAKMPTLRENSKTCRNPDGLHRRCTFGERKVVLFDYRVSRGTDTINKLLTGFQGFMQADGLSSYDNAAKYEGVTRLGCAMHARRRFESAFVNGVKSGKSLGEVGVKYFRAIYDVEDEVREMSPDDRRRIRIEKAKPIWDEMRAWAEKKRSKVPKLSKIGGAFKYLLGEYEFLTNYLLDGRLEIDNRACDQEVRDREKQLAL